MYGMVTLKRWRQHTPVAGGVSAAIAAMEKQEQGIGHSSQLSRDRPRQMIPTKTWQFKIS